MKIGRNAPCPCGSGKKFKKCHDTIRNELPFLIQQARIDKHIGEEGKRLLEQHQAKEIQRQAQQGLGRPIISIEHQGYRFVAVGNNLHYGKWKTFPDFLGNYIKKTLGEAWGNEQLKKPFEDRHTILKWYRHLCELQAKHIITPGQVYSGPMNGAASAYYRLAYNLYLISHNGADIQTRLVSRLRNSDQFPGAFFETQVAAWLIKAGFELNFENESDGSTSHCEFTATYPSSKAQFSVEAKSRYSGKNNEGPRRLNVIRQLRLALEKQANHTRLVFLDLNLPITSQIQADRVLDRVDYLLKSFEDKVANPPAYIFVTNISDHYFLESSETPVFASSYGFKIPDFRGIFRNNTLIEAVRARERHVEIFNLMQSMEKYAHIPQTFDGELPSSAFSDRKVPRMLIGQTYLTPDPDGKEVRGTLTAATVANREMILAFHDPRTDKAWIRHVPMSQAELEDYRQFPDTFFGVYSQQGRKVETPLEFFDFFHKSYRNTPKERLLELMKDAPDFEGLKNFTQTELSEIFCERTVYSIMAAQQKEHGSNSQ